MLTVSYATNFTAEHEPPGYARHSNEFRLVVAVEGPLVHGMVIPFEALAGAVANVLRCMVAVPPVEALPEGSSTEQIAVWIWDQLAPGLPILSAVHLTDGAFTVTYRGDPS